MRRLFFIVLMLVSSEAHGRTSNGFERYSKRYQSCSDSAQGSYTHILGCQGEEQAVQDSKLNKIYSAIMHRLAPTERRLLRTSEREWLAVRDRKCALPLRNRGLSDLVDSKECRLAETLSRRVWLERYR
jgi:uncharacterized protein YecT (DUF1311 family)